MDEPVDHHPDNKRTGSHACQIQIDGDDRVPMFLRPRNPSMSYRLKMFCAHFPISRITKVAIRLVDQRPFFVRWLGTVLYNEQWEFELIIAYKSILSRLIGKKIPAQRPILMSL